MIIRSFDHLPDEARAIRTRVFIREAAWRDEFDECDGVATHLLAYDGSGTAVATCRIHPDPDRPQEGSRWVIGRLAVLPDHQGARIGSTLLAEAERLIARSGGTIAAVHSARDHYLFYERRGYALTADVYDGGSHGWLAKRVADPPRNAIPRETRGASMA